MMRRKLPGYSCGHSPGLICAEPSLAQHKYPGSLLSPSRGTCCELRNEPPGRLWQEASGEWRVLVAHGQIIDGRNAAQPPLRFERHTPTAPPQLRAFQQRFHDPNR